MMRMNLRILLSRINNLKNRIIKVLSCIRDQFRISNPSDQTDNQLKVNILSFSSRALSTTRNLFTTRYPL